MATKYDKSEAAHLLQADYSASFTADGIYARIATSMIGRTVSVLIGPDRTAEGIVSGISFVKGSYRLVVDGCNYGLDQLITASPPPSTRILATSA